MALSTTPLVRWRSYWVTRPRAQSHLQASLELAERLAAPLHELRAKIGLAACGDATAGRSLGDIIERARVAGWIGVINEAELAWRVV